MLVLSVTVHEFAHAFAAHRLGDDLPDRQGRLTLNPAAHADPIGTLLLPALAVLFNWPLFGWGRPVYTNPLAYTRRFSMRAGSAIVSFAGPFANFVMAIVCSGLWVGLEVGGLIRHGSPVTPFLSGMIGMNTTLFLFNLLPFPPLDGSKIVAWIFGPKADPMLDTLSGLGPMFLIIAASAGGSFIGFAAHSLANAMLRGFFAVLS